MKTRALVWLLLAGGVRALPRSNLRGLRDDADAELEFAGAAAARGSSAPVDGDFLGGGDRVEEALELAEGSGVADEGKTSGQTTHRKLQAQGYPMTDSNIRAAVNAWFSGRSAAEATYGHISTWDTSGVTDMSELFSTSRNSAASSFNEDIGAWDTSGVTDMSFMFSGATQFNQWLDWSLKSLEEMSAMFQDARSFDQSLAWCADQINGADVAFEGTKCYETSCGVVSDGCANCPTGNYFSEDDDGNYVCSGCKPGRFSARPPVDDNGRLETSCFPCPVGKISAESGATSCTPCEAGRSVGPLPTSCTTCDFGKYSGGNAAECTNCGDAGYAGYDQNLWDPDQRGAESRGECRCAEGNTGANCDQEPCNLTTPVASLGFLLLEVQWPRFARELSRNEDFVGISAAFRAFDLNGDNYLSVREAKAGIAAGGMAVPLEVSHIWSEGSDMLYEGAITITEMIEVELARLEEQKTKEYYDQPSGSGAITAMEATYPNPLTTNAECAAQSTKPPKFEWTVDRDDRIIYQQCAFFNGVVLTGTDGWDNDASGGKSNVDDADCRGSSGEQECSFDFQLPESYEVKSYYSLECTAPGTFTYEDRTLHCIELSNGELVDVLEVENAPTATCKHTDKNYCPAGYDVWVPRSYEHAKKVRDAVDPKFTNLVGVYREENGCGGCTDVAMNSEAYDEWVSAIDPVCGDLVPVESSECPSCEQGQCLGSLPNCKQAGCGELCDGNDGPLPECGTDRNLDNCPGFNSFGVPTEFDVYRKTCARIGWTSVAGKPWFLRETSYSEPSGDYMAGCWLTTDDGGVTTWDDEVGFRFNDATGTECYYCFTDYLCSRNRPVKIPSKHSYCVETKFCSSEPCTTAATNLTVTRCTTGLQYDGTPMDVYARMRGPLGISISWLYTSPNATVYRVYKFDPALQFKADTSARLLREVVLSTADCGLTFDPLEFRDTTTGSEPGLDVGYAVVPLDEQNGALSELKERVGVSGFIVPWMGDFRVTVVTEGARGPVKDAILRLSHLVDNALDRRYTEFVEAVTDEYGEAVLPVRVQDRTWTGIVQHFRVAVEKNSTTASGRQVTHVFQSSSVTAAMRHLGEGSTEFIDMTAISISGTVSHAGFGAAYFADDCPHMKDGTDECFCPVAGSVE